MSTPEQIKSYLGLKEYDVQEVTKFAQTFFEDDRGVTMREACLIDIILHLEQRSICRVFMYEGACDSWQLVGKSWVIKEDAQAWCDKAKRSTQIFVQHNGESEVALAARFESEHAKAEQN